jgi:ABC-type bacteriocin/lantibiotic exporter with double-glycine peptidase domain
VLIDGQDLETSGLDFKTEFINKIGYLTQESQTFMATILDNILIGNLPLLKDLIHLCQTQSL